MSKNKRRLNAFTTQTLHLGITFQRSYTGSPLFSPLYQKQCIYYILVILDLFIGSYFEDIDLLMVVFCLTVSVMENGYSC